MKLKVIGCTSSGNAFLLEHGGSSLLLDAGVSYKKIVEATGYNPDKIFAALITHEHADHSRACHELDRNGIPLIMTQGTASAVSSGRPLAYAKIQNTQKIMQKPWAIMAFAVQHDANEPVGFLIKHDDADNVICYIPDNGYSRYTPVGLTDLIIECNYIDEKLQEYLDSGLEHALEHYKRLKSNHMSLERTYRQIKLMDRSRLQRIILTHLSDINSDEKQMVESLTGAFNVSVQATTDGTEIDLNLCPF